jgi:hypothetical protein
MTIQCQNCQVTADLKLTVAAPNKARVSALPKADFLVVTWTEAETGAMGRVLGKNVYSFESETSNNFTPLLLPGLAPPQGEQYHAHFFQTVVNGKKVICLKSEFHPKAQTAATTLFFERILGSGANPAFTCLITSGTAGGLWNSLYVGDVVVTNRARYGLTFPKAKQALAPYAGLSNIVGSGQPSGFASWFDYATKEIIQPNTCVNNGLLTSGGRKSSSPRPAIYYQPENGSSTDIVTDERDSSLECTRIGDYRKLGATVDENDAYVADACQAIGFQNWVSIRNVSDLPCSSNGNQYKEYGFCSSINGACAVWAFVMGH